MQHENGEDLYKRMMDAIKSKHARGNAIRYFKLPLILLDSKLYGGAICQFYFLTLTLESTIDKKLSEGGNNEMIEFLKDGLGLKPVAAGYEKDLKQWVLSYYYYLSERNREMDGGYDTEDRKYEKIYCSQTI